MTTLEQMVGQLVERGYRVRFEHLRYFNGHAGNLNVLYPMSTLKNGHIAPDPCGGKTVATVLEPPNSGLGDGAIVAQGVAHCRPDEHYVRSYGAIKALGRAIGKMSEKGRQ